jgi:hypothetical protein
MNLIAEIDSRVISMVQDVYLWLWDRTGVYVGTLIFAFAVLDKVCLARLDFFDFVLVGMMGIWTAGRYLAQANDLRLLNKLARDFSEIWLRIPAIVLIAGVFIYDVLQMNAWRVASHIFFFCWVYLACIQVRDREPKDFLPSLKPVGAR